MYPSPLPDPLASARIRSIARGLTLLAALACVQAHAATKYPTASGQAQSAAILADTEGTSVTSSLLESKLKEVEAATDLDEAAKGKLTEQYRKALSNLEAKKSYEAKAAAFAKALEEAPAETAAAARRQSPVPPEQPETGAGVAGHHARGHRAAAGQAARGYDPGGDPPGRPRQGPGRRSQASRARCGPASPRSSGRSSRSTPSSPRPAAEGEAPALAQARRWALQTARGALIAEGRMLEQELASLDVRTDLLAAQRDKSALDLKADEGPPAGPGGRGQRTPPASAEQARDEAKEAETRRHRTRTPWSRSWPAQNTALGEELTSLTASMDRSTDSARAIQAEAKRIEDDFRSARERLEIVGTNRALGQILADKRRQLPDLRPYRKAIAEREETIADDDPGRDPLPRRARASCATWTPTWTRPSAGIPAGRPRPGAWRAGAPGRAPDRPCSISCRPPPRPMLRALSELNFTRRAVVCNRRGLRAPISRSACSGCAASCPFDRVRHRRPTRRRRLAPVTRQLDRGRPDPGATRQATLCCSGSCCWS